MPSRRQDSWFRERVDALIGSLWSSEYQAIIGEINHLAGEEALRSPSKALSLAAQRTIGDLRVLAAHKKQRSLAECEEAYSQRSQLGFSTIVDEVIAASAHARYLWQIGHAEAAEKCAAAALKKIEGTRQTAKPSVPPELESVLRKIAQNQGE